MVIVILYRRYEDKRLSQIMPNFLETIKQFLLNDIDLAKSKKPILWIHVPYEYNSRNWLSFGSRSSFELNQPYLYLTVRSIINKCEEDFTICLIDDRSFEKLIPNWSIDMNSISSPINDKIRMLGLVKLLYIYGGLLCPISFLCIKNLITLYEKGIQNDKMFLCELIDRNITSTDFNFFPNLSFSGAPKECETTLGLIDFMQRTISTDFTAETKFLGEFNRWCETRIRRNEINVIDGKEIGTKTIDNNQILIDHLLSQNYLNLYPSLYGIYIPANEILNRRYYEWFSRLSEKQVLESNTIIGNYFLVTLGEDNMNMNKGKVLEPIIVRPQGWTAFWKTPLYPSGLYGNKPNFLGDNISTLQS
jgi:hypothetical protein